LEHDERKVGTASRSAGVSKASKRMDGSPADLGGLIIAGSVPTVGPELEGLGARAAAFARASKSPATERAYASDWRYFEAWCSRAGLTALPAAPATIGGYLAHRADDLKVASLNRCVAAIVAAHRVAGHSLDREHPAISAVLAGIRRRFGSRQEAKTAILTADLRKMVRALPATLAGVRDAAVLLIGFAGAFRRSELAALDLEDVEVTDLGLILTIHRSKTDQVGAGRKIGIPRGRKGTCPVEALDRWIKAGRISSEALFTALDRSHAGERISGQAIAEVVKRAAVRALASILPATLDTRCALVLPKGYHRLDGIAGDRPVPRGYRWHTRGKWRKAGRPGNESRTLWGNTTIPCKKALWRLLCLLPLRERGAPAAISGSVARNSVEMIGRPPRRLSGQAGERHLPALSGPYPR
jgi:site-specific recombinase XerD